MLSTLDNCTIMVTAVKGITKAKIEIKHEI